MNKLSIEQKIENLLSTGVANSRNVEKLLGIDANYNVSNPALVLKNQLDFELSEVNTLTVEEVEELKSLAVDLAKDFDNQPYMNIVMLHICNEDISLNERVKFLCDLAETVRKYTI